MYTSLCIVKFTFEGWSLVAVINQAIRYNFVTRIDGRRSATGHWCDIIAYCSTKIITIIVVVKKEEESIEQSHQCLNICIKNKREFMLSSPLYFYNSPRES